MNFKDYDRFQKQNIVERKKKCKASVVGGTGLLCLKLRFMVRVGVEKRRKPQATVGFGLERGCQRR